MFVSRETHDGPTEGNEPQISTRCHVTITTRSRPFITHISYLSHALFVSTRVPLGRLSRSRRGFFIALDFHLHRVDERMDVRPNAAFPLPEPRERTQRTTRVRLRALDRRLSRLKESPHGLAPGSVRSVGHAFRAFHRPTARLVFAPFLLGALTHRKTDRRRASRPRHRRARGLSDPRATVASPTRGSRKCEETDPRDRGPRDVSRCRRGRRVPGPRHRARACRKTGPRYPARDRRGALRLEGVRGRAAGEAGFRGARDRHGGGGPSRGRTAAG